MPSGLWSGGPSVLSCRLTVICYTAGLLGISYRRVIVALLLGEVPLVLGYLFLTQLALDLLG